MKRWNGWGNLDTDYPVQPAALAYLTNCLGPLDPRTDAAKETVLAAVRGDRLPAHPLVDTSTESRLTHARGQSLPDWVDLRLLARYGPESAQRFEAAPASDHLPISSTPHIFGELRQAARSEGVIHLDDLLLRRVRLGLLLPNGGMDLLPRIRAIVQSELGWDDARWEQETSDYAELWNRAYRLY